MTEADDLLKEVIEEHVYVGNEANWCIFCGRWPDNHEFNCLASRIKEYLAKLEDRPAPGE